LENGDQRERERRRKMRSLAIGLALGALVILFYVATLVRMGSHVMNRPL
jgi:hypothetical protein